MTIATHEARKKWNVTSDATLATILTFIRTAVNARKFWLCYVVPTEGKKAGSTMFEVWTRWGRLGSAGRPSRIAKVYAHGEARSIFMTYAAKKVAKGYRYVDANGNFEEAAAPADGRNPNGMVLNPKPPVKLSLVTCCGNIYSSEAKFCATCGGLLRQHQTATPATGEPVRLVLLGDEED